MVINLFEILGVFLVGLGNSSELRDLAVSSQQVQRFEGKFNNLAEINKNVLQLEPVYDNI